MISWFGHRKDRIKKSATEGAAFGKIWLKFWAFMRFLGVRPSRNFEIFIALFDSCWGPTHFGANTVWRIWAKHVGADQHRLHTCLGGTPHTPTLVTQIENWRFWWLKWQKMGIFSLYTTIYEKNLTFLVTQMAKNGHFSIVHYHLWEKFGIFGDSKRKFERKLRFWWLKIEILTIFEKWGGTEFTLCEKSKHVCRLS